MKKLLACGAAIAALAATTAAHAAYPSIGADTLGPQYIITITSGGASIALDGSHANQGPYDQIEDTYIGVNNLSGGSVGFLDLVSSNGAFGFDGDGLCAYNFAACALTDPAGQNGGYAGLGTYFSNITDSNHGRINFVGGLANGGTAFFSLEETLDTATFQISHVGGIPEPATWAMMLVGFFGVGGLLRSRRRATAIA